MGEGSGRGSGRVGSGQTFGQQSRVGSGRVNASPGRVGSGPRKVTRGQLCDTHQCLPNTRSAVKTELYNSITRALSYMTHRCKSVPSVIYNIGPMILLYRAVGEPSQSASLATRRTTLLFQIVSTTIIILLPTYTCGRIQKY